MGLLDSLNSPDMGFAMGLLSAGGPSRMPISLGQGLAQGYQGYQQAQQAQQAEELRKLQLKHLQMQMEAEAQMKPLQIQQLQSAIDQSALQRQIAAQFPKMVESMRGGQQQPTPYQDQIRPDQVGSNGLPSVGGTMTPEKYFGLAANIQDPTEKRSAIEAGLRQWPQLRPNIQNNGNATDRDPATTLGAYAAMMGTAGLKGGDEVMKFAQMMQPRELKEGSTYQNPLSGHREFMPKMDVGMQPSAGGGIQAVPGMMDFIRQKTEASVDPVARSKAIFETGIDPLGGNGWGKKGGEATVLTPKAEADIRAGAYSGGNDDWLKNSYRPTLEAGKSADTMLANVQALRNIDLNTGWGAEAKAAAANALAGLGIAPKNAEMFAANAQKFQSVAMTRLWEVLNNAKGPQTEGDADRAKATFASIKNTNDANQFIIDMAEANARRDKLRAGFYSEAMPVARDSGDMTAVDRKWRQIQRSIWDDPIMAKWKK